jgi:hypothetical protein
MIDAGGLEAAIALHQEDDGSAKEEALGMIASAFPSLVASLRTDVGADERDGETNVVPTGLTALNILACGSDECRLFFEEDGCIITTLLASCEEGAPHNIALHCLAVLKNLASSDDNCTSIMVSAPEIVAILSTLARPQNRNDEIRASAFGVMRNLALLPSAKEPLAAAGALEAAMAVINTINDLETAPDHLKVSAVNFARILVSNCPANAMLGADALMHIPTATDLGGSHNKLAFEFARFVVILVRTGHRRHDFYAQPSVFSLIALLLEHSHPLLRDEACGALQGLLFSSTASRNEDAEEALRNTCRRLAAESGVIDSLVTLKEGQTLQEEAPPIENSAVVEEASQRPAIAAVAAQLHAALVGA